MIIGYHINQHRFGCLMHMMTLYIRQKKKKEEFLSFLNNTCLHFHIPNLSFILGGTDLSSWLLLLRIFSKSAYRFTAYFIVN